MVTTVDEVETKGIVTRGELLVRKCPTRSKLCVYCGINFYDNTKPRNRLTCSPGCAKELKNKTEREKYRIKNPKPVYIGREAAMHAASLRRMARIRLLSDDLSTEQLSRIKTYFHNECAITGASVDIHVDHVIPIGIGHVGTTYGNMIPLAATLNLSKNDRHIFEWFDANRERFGLTQDKFDDLITYLAESNEMTTQEYRAYVDWCFDNPREVCEETGELVFIDGPINERVTK